jgi:hypothetical protein
LQVEEVAHQITKYVLHIKAMVRECQMLTGAEIVQQTTKD